MPKNKNIFKQIWEWLLDMGLIRAALVLNTIHILVYVGMMWLIHWIDKHY